MTGIECEALIENLGFKTTHITRVSNYRDLNDYVDLFCGDMYKTCPYYQAVMTAKYKEGR